MDVVRMWKLIYLAERFAAGAYWEFAHHMPCERSREVMVEFGDDERMHARWFAGELGRRAVAEPAWGDRVERIGAGLGRLQMRLLGPRKTLRAFHRGEMFALTDLYKLIDRARDEDFRKSLVRIQPYEEKHAYWYAGEGRKLLRG